MTKQYVISGTGSYLPPLQVTNNQFAEIMDTSDEWITTRTGIQRRHLSVGEATWELGLKAAQAALAAAHLTGQDLDMIIVSTMMPDYSTPTVSCILQDELGAKEASCVDINAACTGFIQAFDIAVYYLSHPDKHHILIVSAESLSKICDYTDRSTCVLFGDGAGAAVVSNVSDGQAVDEKIYASHIGADGELGHAIVGRAFDVAVHPFMQKSDLKPRRFEPDNGRYVQMQGQDVYRFATMRMPYAVEKVMTAAGLSKEDLSYIVPHQANERILQAAARRLKIPMEKIISHIKDQGNTSSASIPLCLDLEIRQGRIKRGQKLVMTGFGGGLTYGALACEY